MATSPTRRYGEKVLKETGVPRSYYKCSVSGCNAKKYVEYTEDGDVAECIIKGEHNHGRSRTNARDGAAPSRASARKRTAPAKAPVVCSCFLGWSLTKADLSWLGLLTITTRLLHTVLLPPPTGGSSCWWHLVIGRCSTKTAQAHRTKWYVV